MLRRALTIALLVGAFGWAPSVAHAQERTCQLDPDTGILKCYIIAQPAPPRAVRISPDLPIEWVRTPLYDFEVIMRELGCYRTLDDVIEVGASYLIMIRNTDTLELLHLHYECVLPGDPPPQPPPPPPTPGDLVADNEQALTLTPSFSPSLEIGGLTGLDTWVWCTDPGLVDAGVSLRGWTAAGQVELATIGWTIAGPEAIEFATGTCGAEASPAVVWTPEAMGDYSITATAVWTGSWDLTWAGIVIGTYPLGPLSLTSLSIPYEVDEYRGELTE